MRIVAPEPEAKRFARWNRLEELSQILERRSGRIVGETARAEIAGTPSLARGANGVTRLFEQIRVNRKFPRQKSPKTTPLFQPMRVLPREHGRPRGSAGRRGAKAITKSHPFASHAIERGRMDHPIA